MATRESLGQSFAHLQNFGDVARHWSAERPDRVAFRFLAEDESEAERLTFRDLDRRARQIAGELTRQGCAGEPVLLLYKPGLEFICGFFACLYAGSIATPAYPPTGRPSRQSRLDSIIEDSGARVILTSSPTRDLVLREIGGLDAVRPMVVIASDLLENSERDDTPTGGVTRSSIAFLQYTSGSTGNPKGVMVSHDNLFANQRAIQSGFAHGPDTVFVGWCPLYHDMGLIGNVLQPVYLGIESILMSPVAFLQNPMRWLRAISRYRATTSGGPNFAYGLCAARATAEDKVGLDLSSWRVAFNGAEPIRAETLLQFSAQFAECGFQPGAHFPCYGMAETTLFVTGAEPAGGAIQERVRPEGLSQNRFVHTDDTATGCHLVSSGRVRDDQRVRIVEPESRREAEPGHIAEIWVQGSSVAAGYWKRQAETASAFGAEILGQEHLGQWLRTGDLGVLADGELFVTGRRKELIIVRGRNHYPQDIELTVQASHPSFRIGCGAAFGVPHPEGERLVVVQEIHRTQRASTDISALHEAASKAVAGQHGVTLHELIVVQPGTVPKTSSGKTQRGAVRSGYLRGEFAATPGVKSGEAAARHRAGLTSFLPAAAARTPADIRQGIFSWISAATGLREDDLRHTTLSDLGLDSLALINIQTQIKEALGVDIAFDALLDAESTAALAEWVAGMSPPSSTPLPADIRAASVPRVSPYQQALWLAQRMSPDSASFNLSVPIRLHRQVPVDDIQSALQALLRRHPELTGGFEVDASGALVRRMGKLPEAQIRIHPCTDSRDEQIARIAAVVREPISLDQGPLFRIEVFDLGASGCIVTPIAHHLVVDQWSLQTVLREFLALLAERVGDHRAALAAPPYVDYVEAIQSELARHGEAQSRYWADVLAAPIEPLNLPFGSTLREVEPPDDEIGVSVDTRVPPELLARLDQVARTQRSTPNMVLLAAFQLLLHRYTSQRDIAVITPCAVRPGASFDSWVGYGVNPLVIRTEVDPESDFSRLLSSVRTRLSGALANRMVPFAELVRRHARRDSAERHPFSRAMFVYHYWAERDATASLMSGRPGLVFSVGGLEVEGLALPTVEAQTDLALVAARDDQGLTLRFEYDGRLARRATIRRLADHYLQLLESICSLPGMPVSELPILPEQERRRILSAWNQTGHPDAEAPSAAQLIRTRASQWPDRAAVIAEDAVVVPYRQLVLEAEAIARGLVSRGIGRGDLVGVGMSRTPRLLATLLAIWSAGAAYVPLDLGQPDDRLRAIAEDAAVACMVSDAESLARMRRVFPGCLEASELLAHGSDRHDLVLPPAHPEDLAYVLFTSGSTGRPKGVEIRHTSVLSLLAWIGGAYGADDLSGVFAGTSIAFDISVFELFGPLAHGGTVVLGSDALALPRARAPVTLLNTVPSAAATLLANKSIPTTVRIINLAGEPLKQSLVDALYAGTRVRAVHDLYGPTEDTVYSTSALREPQGIDTVGRPLPCKRLYILDAHRQPVPAGVVGEVYLAGAGLARGYRGRPDLTAAAFVEDSGIAHLEPRLYKTGDIGRFLPDGRVVLSGRADHQVKIRGYRIELGEIEAALMRHPRVSAAVAHVARLDAGPLLLAHVVTSPDPSSPDVPLNLSDLEAWLADQLPAYMRPALQSIDRIPLTANGKVDRKALPAPRVNERPTEDISPATDTERLVAEICRQALSVGSLGTEQNLYELGAHSLSMARIANELREALGVDIPLTVLLEEPVVRSIAACCDLLLRRQSVKASDDGDSLRREVVL